MARVVIVGGNRGIGLALARNYASKGHEVVVSCRQKSTTLAGEKVRICEGVDVTREDGATTLARFLGDDRVDVAIVNAGILERDTLDTIDLASVERQLMTNAVAPLRIVRAMRKNLGNGSKLGLVTSRMGSIGDNGSGGYYGYRMSKAALNAMGMSLARDLKSDNVAVAILHPGFVKTDMTGGNGQITADESAAGLVARMDALTLATTGTFWHMNGEVLPW